MQNSGGDTMTIHVTLNDEDYIAYNIHHAFHSKQDKKALMLGRLIMLCISIPVMLAFVVAGADKLLILVEMLVLLALSAVWYFRYPAFAKKSIRKHVGKLRQQGKLPYSEESEVEFGETEIAEIAPGSVKRVAYSDVQSVQESEEYIYVYVGAIEALILPRRCLEDGGDAVLAFLREKCGQ